MGIPANHWGHWSGGSENAANCGMPSTLIYGGEKLEDAGWQNIASSNRRPTNRDRKSRVGETAREPGTESPGARGRAFACIAEIHPRVTILPAKDEGRRDVFTTP